MIPKNDWRVALRDATHSRAVMDVLLQAVSAIPPALLDTLPVHFRPRSLASRDDVEHWGRRLDTAQAIAQPARALMREYFTAGLLRLNEIGPVRRARA